MIVDSNVFEDDRLPNRLLHRDREVAYLKTSWSRREDVLLYGSSGVGKTTLVRHTLNHLEPEHDIDHCVVRCMGLTTAGVIRHVLRGLPGPNPAETTAQEDLCLQLRERVDRPTVVVLDEADDLVEHEAMLRLNDVDDITLVVICHKPDKWLAAADFEIRRRLRSTVFEIEKFSTRQLANILSRRADLGLRDGSVTDEQLTDIADGVAGVARKGIQVLRSAAEEAMRNGHERIRESDIEAAYDLAQRRILKLNLYSLPFHHQFLYELIRMSGGISASDLHEWYEDVAPDIYEGRPMTPITKGDRRRKLRKLRGYELVERVGQGRGTEYHPTNSSIIAPLDIGVVERGTVER